MPDCVGGCVGGYFLMCWWIFDARSMCWWIPQDRLLIKGCSDSSGGK